MNIEDDISKRLLQGYTPNQLIEEGFKKSTVYKVNQKIKARSMPTSKPDWQIINITPREPRSIPGNTTSISFTFENSFKKDMYLYRVGIFTEWMENDTWIAQKVGDLIKSGQRRYFNFRLSVPEGIALGEYAMTFGIESQYMPVIEHQSLQTQWTDPLTFHVKEPFTGTSIFFSHSTKDLTLVRQLEQQLDNNGIKVIIAEDIKEPGIELNHKFESKILSSTIFLALLTENGVNSKWVIRETQFAEKNNKPTILLKEENVSIQTGKEWVSFSRNDQPDYLFQKIMEAINYQKNTQASPLAPLIGGALLILLLGLAFGSKK